MNAIVNLEQTFALLASQGVVRTLAQRSCDAIAAVGFRPKNLALAILATQILLLGLFRMATDAGAQERRRS